MKNLFIILFLFPPLTLFAQTNKIVQDIYKGKGQYYVLDNDMSFSVDTSIVTIKVKDIKLVKRNYTIVRSNNLGYIDLRVPNNMAFITFIENLKNDVNVTSIICSTFGYYNTFIPNDTYLNNQCWTMFI